MCVASWVLRVSVLFCLLPMPILDFTRAQRRASFFIVCITLDSKQHRNGFAAADHREQERSAAAGATTTGSREGVP